MKEVKYLSDNLSKNRYLMKYLIKKLGVTRVQILGLLNDYDDKLDKEILKKIVEEIEKVEQLSIIMNSKIELEVLSKESNVAIEEINEILKEYDEVKHKEKLQILLNKLEKLERENKGLILNKIRREELISLRRLSEISNISIREIVRIENEYTKDDEKNAEKLIEISKRIKNSKKTENITEEKKQLRQTINSDLEKLEKRNLNYKLFQITSLFILASILLIFRLLIDTPHENIIKIEPKYVGLLLLITLLIIITFFMLVKFFKISFVNPTESLKLKERRINELNLEESKEKISKDFFNSLIKINIEHLTIYYKQTQDQANKSFSMARNASYGGFLVLLIGICLVFNDKISTGYLTTAIGVMIEFIAAIFFYLYNRTIIKMGEYHKKLVLTQNISLALKATDDFELEKKMEMRSKIIDEIMKDINKYLSQS